MKKTPQFCTQISFNTNGYGSYLTSLSYPNLHLKEGFIHVTATTNSL